MPSSGPEGWEERLPEGFAPPSSSAFRLSRYELRERLGEGATAVVYAAWDRELQRDVAIKVLRETVGMSEIARERFRREAQAAAGLSHPNLVTVYDAGTFEGQSYLVMERLTGKSLDDRLREHRDSDREIVKILERAARGVAAAHEKGIVHRDLKPANILISTSGDPKVGDFGMAHLMDSRMELTRTGVPLGTPLYMAPEQVQGRAQDITRSTDVYGLGAILYQMLAGRPPHTADSIMDLYGKIARDEPVPPRRLRPGVAPELEAIALKALEKEPERRYASAALFAEDLARYLDGRPVEARPASLAYRFYRRLRKHRTAVAGAAAALLAIAGVAIVGHHRESALEQERLKDRRAADERVRLASEQTQDSSRRREESMRRLSNLWGRTMAVLEWRQQPSRKTAEIRQELEGLLAEAAAYVKDYPDLPQGRYIRARAHQFGGNGAAAEADLVAALDRHPDFSPGWALLAQLKLERYVERLYAWSERERDARRKEWAPLLREAEDALRRCDGGAPGKAAWERWGLSWTRVDAINETVMLALKQRHIDNDMQGAKARLEKAQAITPAAEFCDLIGSWSGDVAKVVPWLEQATTLSPHWARPYVNRAVAYRVMGNRKKAGEELTRALEIQPSFALAYEFRGWYRIQDNELDAGIRDCDRALELDPRMASTFAHRAEGWRLKGEFQEAIRDCSDALKLAPEMASAWGIRGHSQLLLGQFTAALEDLTRAIELAPEEPLYYFHRGAVHLARREPPKVIADCDKALQLSPADWLLRPDVEKMKAMVQRQ